MMVLIVCLGQNMAIEGERGNTREMRPVQNHHICAKDSVVPTPLAAPYDFFPHSLLLRWTVHEIRMSTLMTMSLPFRPIPFYAVALTRSFQQQDFARPGCRGSRIHTACAISKFRTQMELRSTPVSAASGARPTSWRRRSTRRGWDSASSSRLCDLLRMTKHMRAERKL